MSSRILPNLKVGVRVRLNGQRVSWEVTARNDSYIVCVRQAPFSPKGEHQYTIIEHSDYCYNFAGPGLILTTLNTMGGGWEIDGRVTEGSREIIDALESGEWETSHRRREDLRELEELG